LDTANSAVAPWQTAHASPSTVVFDSACDAVEISVWHPVHADVVGCTGLIGPRGSVTARVAPIGGV
jgi:hypothetical protein